MIATIVLICGVVASLALGVLVAYTLCWTMFGLFRIHTRQVTAARIAAEPEAKLGTISS